MSSAGLIVITNERTSTEGNESFKESKIQNPNSTAAELEPPATDRPAGESQHTDTNNRCYIQSHTQELTTRCISFPSLSPLLSKLDEVVPNDQNRSVRF